MKLYSSIWLRRHLEKALGIWIQWMDSVLLQGQQVEFFHDEFFCLVYVKYMVNVIVFRENLVIRCPKKKTWLSGMSSTCRILWNLILQQCSLLWYGITVLHTCKQLYFISYQYHGDCPTDINMQTAYGWICCCCLWI